MYGNTNTKFIRFQWRDAATASAHVCNMSPLIFFQSVWRTRSDIQPIDLTTDPAIPMQNWHKKLKRWKRREIQTKQITFPCLNADHGPPMRIFSYWVVIEEAYSLSVSATTGPCPFISGWVTIKSPRSVMTSAVVALFGSEGYVQFTQCSRSYRGWQQEGCWIFIATCPLPSPGWAF